MSRGQKPGCSKSRIEKEKSELANKTRRNRNLDFSKRREGNRERNQKGRTIDNFYMIIFSLIKPNSFE